MGDLPQTPLPTVPRSVAWSAIGSMFGVLACTLAMFRVESGLVVTGLVILGFGGPVLWSAWMRSVLARAGGPFAVPEVRAHAAVQAERGALLLLPLLVMGIAAWTLPGAPTPGDDLAGFGTAAVNGALWMLLSFAMLVAVPPWSWWRVVQHRRLAVLAHQRWLARRQDPRVVRWTTIRDRAEGSDRTRALAEDVLRDLETVLLHPESHGVRLAEIDAAADRLEARLGPSHSALEDRVEEAVAELDAVSEVDRMAHVRARARQHT